MTLDQDAVQFIVGVGGTLTGLATGLFVAGRKRGAQDARAMTKEECATVREHCNARIEKALEKNVDAVAALTREVDRMAGAMERNGYHLGRPQDNN